jgi:hypothetical protein
MTGLFPTRNIEQEQLTTQERLNTREFKGDGTPFLKLPGCVSITRVKVGTTELPPYVTNKFPLDADAKEHVSSDWPLYDLSTDETGTPVLVRSVQSNDGIWQEGVTISVTGEWAKAGGKG